MKRLFLSCLLTLFAAVAACQSSVPPAAQPGPTDQQVAPGSVSKTAEPAGMKPSAPPAVGAALDNVRKGMAYADFRSALLTDGWQPLVDLKCKANVVGGAYKELCARGVDSCKACDELPELSACSGDAVCLMRFRDPDTHRQLDVSTYGDIGDRVVHGTDSQLNVTGWTVSPQVGH